MCLLKEMVTILDQPCSKFSASTILPDVHSSLPLFLSSEDLDDALNSTHFETLEPPLADEDYLFSLEHCEGVMDLFDMNSIVI